MTPCEVVFSPQARDDLLNLYRYIAEHSGADRAIGYLDRVETFCLSLSTFPKRGPPRDDLFPGLRVVGFERRVAIAFHVDPGKVTIDRILYGGRDLGLLKQAADP